MLPYTTFESVDPEDLCGPGWRPSRTASGTPVLAIPHNGNLSNGLMFAFETYGGEPLSEAYALRRQRFEPIYEVTQIKGDGEAHPCSRPDDEFADYETWDEGNLNLIPTLGEVNSRGGFPRRSCRNSSWKTGEGFPWRRRSVFEAISLVTICGDWRGPAGMRSRSGGCWRWR